MLQHCEHRPDLTNRPLHLTLPRHQLSLTPIQCLGRRILSHRTANIDATHANTMPSPRETGPAHRTHALGSFDAIV